MFSSPGFRYMVGFRLRGDRRVGAGLSVSEGFLGCCCCCCCSDDEATMAMDCLVRRLLGGQLSEMVARAGMVGANERMLCCDILCCDLWRQRRLLTSSSSSFLFRRMVQFRLVEDRNSIPPLPSTIRSSRFLCTAMIFSG